jgi:hypothetical protein
MVLFVVVEFKLRTINSEYEKKQKGLLEKSSEIEILILGNSRSDNGLNPAFFSKPAYNLAYGSQTILYDKQLVLKYLPILKKLKYVVLSLDYHSLSSGYLQERDFFYYHYFDINVKNKDFIKEKLSYFFYVYTPKVSIKLLQENKHVKMVNGWSGYDSSISSRLTERYGKERAQSFDLAINQSRKTKEYIEVQKEYEDLIRFLNENNITPIIITAPCNKPFTKFLDEKNIQYNIEFIQKMKRKYNLVYLNSLNDSAFNVSDFYNNDHLNKKGAEKYTKKIDSLVNTQ